MARLDVERFILEVQTRPALWDMSSEVYSDRDVKRNSWLELVGLFIEKENSTEEEKNEFGKCIVNITLNNKTHGTFNTIIQFIQDCKNI
jgi:hypothetical protein